MKKYVAEAFGTFVLVLVGCGTIVFAGAQVGPLGISFAFGLGLVAAAYTIGGISGCHINPAVTAGAWAAGRMSVNDVIGYIIGQVAGAILAALLVLIIAKGRLAGYDVSANGLGQNGFGAGYLGQYNIVSAIIFEFVATLIFVFFIMEVTEDRNMSQLAGLLIGLVLLALNIFGIQITGVSVNPARSIGPALFAGPYAWAQLPVFIIVPLAGGLVAGYLSKSRMLSAADKKGEGEKAIADIASMVKALSDQVSEKVKTATSTATSSAKDLKDGASKSAGKAVESVSSAKATGKTKPVKAKSGAAKTTVRKSAPKKKV